jgi:plasmid maintenance system killer protein
LVLLELEAVGMHIKNCITSFQANSVCSALKLGWGDRKGQYAISINKQWRVCFEWNEGNAYHVEITDYH